MNRKKPARALRSAGRPRRPQLDASTSDVWSPATADPDPGLAQALSLKPAELDRMARRVSARLVELPMGRLSTVARRQHRMALAPDLGSLLRSYARAAATYAELLRDPPPLLELARKLAQYKAMQQRSAHWLHAAGDARMLLGAAQALVLGRILSTVRARLAAPDCSRAERELLETRFGKLLQVEQLAVEAGHQRAALAARRAAYEALAAEIDRRTHLADVMSALRRGQVVDAASLEAAARTFHEQQLRAEQAPPAAPEEAQPKRAPARARRTRAPTRGRRPTR